MLKFASEFGRRRGDSGLDGADRNFEDLADLAVAQLLHVSQDQDFAVDHWQGVEFLPHTGSALASARLGEWVLAEAREGVLGDRWIELLFSRSPTPSPVDVEQIASCRRPQVAVEIRDRTRVGVDPSKSFVDFLRRVVGVRSEQLASQMVQPLAVALLESLEPAQGSRAFGNQLAHLRC